MEIFIKDKQKLFRQEQRTQNRIVYCNDQVRRSVRGLILNTKRIFDFLSFLLKLHKLFQFFCEIPAFYLTKHFLFYNIVSG